MTGMSRTRTRLGRAGNGLPDVVKDLQTPS